MGYYNESIFFSIKSGINKSNMILIKNKSFEGKFELVDLYRSFDQTIIAKINSDIKKESKVARVVLMVNSALCKKKAKDLDKDECEKAEANQIVRLEDWDVQAEASLDEIDLTLVTLSQLKDEERNTSEVPVTSRKNLISDTLETDSLESMKEETRVGQEKAKDDIVEGECVSQDMINQVDNKQMIG